MNEIRHTWMLNVSPPFHMHVNGKMWYITYITNYNNHQTMAEHPPVSAWYNPPWLLQGGAPKIAKLVYNSNN